MRRKNGTVWAHEGYLHPHNWKWAIPTPQVGSGRGTGWPYFVKSPVALTHSVESPIMVDPPVEYMVFRVQVKFVHSLLMCGWLWVGHNLCLLGITYVCFIPSWLPVLAVEPQYRHQDFLFLSKVQFGHKDTYKIFKIFHVGLKFKWDLWDQYWVSCERLPFEVFFSCLCDGDIGLLGVTYANMLVTTQWPLKRAAHLTSLVWLCVVWRPESLIELSALCCFLPSFFAP